RRAEDRQRQCPSRTAHQFFPSSCVMCVHLSSSSAPSVAPALPEPARGAAWCTATGLCGLTTGTGLTVCGGAGGGGATAGFSITAGFSATAAAVGGSSIGSTIGLGGR